MLQLGLGDPWLPSVQAGPGHASVAVSDGAWLKGCCLSPAACSNVMCLQVPLFSPAPHPPSLLQLVFARLASPLKCLEQLQQFCHSSSPQEASAVQAKDESEVPLTINCWPSASGADSYVNIEYESNASFDLQDIVIAIPLPALASSPKVNQVSNTAARLQNWQSASYDCFGTQGAWLSYCLSAQRLSRQAVQLLMVAAHHTAWLLWGAAHEVLTVMVL